MLAGSDWSVANYWVEGCVGKKGGKKGKRPLYKAQHSRTGERRGSEERAGTTILLSLPAPPHQTVRRSVGRKKKKGKREGVWG